MVRVGGGGGMGDGGLVDSHTPRGPNEKPSENLPEGSNGKIGEAAVLLHLERCAHRQTRRTLQELKEKFESLQQELNTRSIKLGNYSVRLVIEFFLFCHTRL